MAKYTVERCGVGHKRRIVRDSELIGFALLTTNGRWLAADVNGIKLVSYSFAGVIDGVRITIRPR